MSNPEWTNFFPGQTITIYHDRGFGIRLRVEAWGKPHPSLMKGIEDKELQGWNLTMIEVEENPEWGNLWANDYKIIPGEKVFLEEKDFVHLNWKTHKRQ